jgi:hypothetical protein
MNERIRELAVQAKEETDTLWAKLTPQEFKDTYNQKFAELIVRECADNIAGNIDLINPESSYNYGLRRAMNSVKEHFGVEE